MPVNGKEAAISQGDSSPSLRDARILCINSEDCIIGIIAWDILDVFPYSDRGCFMMIHVGLASGVGVLWR